jgi:hypothetical protein
VCGIEVEKVYGARFSLVVKVEDVGSRMSRRVEADSG